MRGAGARGTTPGSLARPRALNHNAVEQDARVLMRERWMSEIYTLVVLVDSGRPDPRENLRLHASESSGQEARIALFTDILNDVAKKSK